MNKERSLTWKYFWQQKWEEIEVPFWLIIGSGIFIFFCYVVVYAEEWNWQSKVLLVYGILIVLFLLIEDIISIYEWVKSNWKKAKGRAKKEMKKK